MRTKLANFFFSSFLKILLRYGIDMANCHVLTDIRSDLYRYRGIDDLKFITDEAICNPGFRFTLFLRLCTAKPQSALRKIIHKFSYYFHRKYFFKYGYQIPIATEIAKGFQILHFGNIVFNPLCKIGFNCTVAQGVLIGQSNSGVPVIGNRVWIGANAIIVGGIKIGSNSLVSR